MSVFILCITIFFCRILDVSLATIRTLCTVKKKIYLSVVIGFVEVLIWFLIVREALNTETSSIWVALSYAGGYSMGTLIGGLLAYKFIRTNILVQIVTREGNKSLIKDIRDAGFGSTSVTVYGKSSQDKKYLIYVETNNTNIKRLKKLIKEKDPTAFVVVNESQSVMGGYFTNDSKKE